MERRAFLWTVPFLIGGGYGLFRWWNGQGTSPARGNSSADDDLMEIWTAILDRMGSGAAQDLCVLAQDLLPSEGLDLSREAMLNVAREEAEAIKDSFQDQFKGLQAGLGDLSRYAKEPWHQLTSNRRQELLGNLLATAPELEGLTSKPESDREVGLRRFLLELRDELEWVFWNHERVLHFVRQATA